MASETELRPSVEPSLFVNDPRGAALMQDVLDSLTYPFYMIDVADYRISLAKHAGVNEAQIRLRRHRRCVCLCISDRGRGFDPQTLYAAPGFGVLRIRERAEMFCGRLTIRSAAGKGTSFRLVVPDGPERAEGPRTERLKPDAVPG